MRKVDGGEATIACGTFVEAEDWDREAPPLGKSRYEQPTVVMERDGQVVRCNNLTI